MKKFLHLSLLFVLLASLLAGCAAPAAQSAGAIQVVDGLERAVSLDEPAQRIVSMAPSVTELLFAVGAGDQVVGRDSFSNYPESVLDLPDVGGSMGDFSFEAITSLNPDLVIAAEINTPEQVKSLEDLGITVYYLNNPVEFDDLYPCIETVGALSGHEQQAAELVESLKTRVEKVTQTVAVSSFAPVVFYELDGSDPAKPWTAGPGTFMDQMIRMAGGINVGASMQDAWAQISLEQLLVENPDLILLGDAAYGMTPDQVADRNGWQTLKAIENDKIYEFNDDLVSRPGPRLVDGLEELAKLLHPELFD